MFGVFCRRWGVPLIDGGTVRLPRLIGVSRAMDMVLTGRAVSAREAFDMGLVNRVVPDGASRAAAEELADEDGHAGEVVPVRLHSHVTEVGTLDLWCRSTRDDRRWKLEFNVRESPED